MGQDICFWEQSDDGDGYFNTTCGQCFEFEVDGPIENGFKFCPYCGKKLDADVMVLK